MALTRQTMTDEQRKSVALEYLKAFDKAGVTSDGGSVLDLFAEDAQVYFPKWGLADGREAIGRLFADVGGTLKGIVHHYASFNWIFSGGDVVVCEGTSHGEHKDGSWRVGMPEWGAGRWCDVFEIRDWKIQRCFIHFNPDYAGRDTARYPWGDPELEYAWERSHLIDKYGGLTNAEADYDRLMLREDQRRGPSYRSHFARRAVPRIRLGQAY